MLPSIWTGLTNPLAPKRTESLSDSNSARYKGLLVEYLETGGKGFNVCGEGRNSKCVHKYKKERYTNHGNLCF